MQILAGTAIANKALLSGASSSPAWSAYNMPASFAGAGEILYTSNATALSNLVAGISGTYLRSNGAAAPIWQRISLSSSAEVMNVLPIANGGTNSGFPLSGSSIMISNGSAMVQGQAGTASTVLHGNIAGPPTYGTIFNSDVDASAAIAGTKISPDFGTQAIVTTGTLTAGNTTVGTLSAGNTTVAGNITISGTVDGRDVSTDGTNQDALQTLSGVAAGITNLGTFTGVTIADNSTIKIALQALETAAETGLAHNLTAAYLNGNDLITSGGKNVIISGSEALEITAVKGLIANTVKISGGNIDGTTIGATTAAPASVTNLTATGTVNLGTDAIQAPEIQDGAVTSAKILDGTILTADIADANVTVSKLGTSGATDANRVYTTNAIGVPTLLPISIFTASYLLNGEIYIGDAADNAVGRTMSGDATITNTGILTISNDAITSAKILEGTIVDADVNAAAAISGTKISPDFGSQNVVTTGTITGSNLTGTNTGDNAVNTTSNAYADTKVADVITNGVMTVAPSENAVFDALALKAATNQTFYLGTTQIGIDRASASQLLTGISIDGNAATATTSTNLTGGLGGSIPYQTGAGATAMSLVGTAGQVLTSNGAAAPSWTTPTTGTVTSVGLSLPAFITVSGSPVTGSGTLTGTLANQSANMVFAAPNGSAGLPAFRSLVAADIPNIAESQVTNLTTDLSNRALTSTTVNGHALSGNVTVSATDITTGILPHAQLPSLVSADIPNNTANTSGNAATATKLTPGNTINGVNFDGASPIIVAAAAGTLTGNTLNAGVVNSSLTSVGTLGSLAVTGAVTAGSFTGPLTGNVTGNLTGNVTGNVTGDITGNAATATKLTPGNTINGVNFDGASAIVVTAAAGTLTGNTLNAGVVNSSLTSVGTLGSLAVTGAVTAGSFTGPLTGNVTGNLTGNVTGNITGDITGNAATATKLTPGNTINGVNFDGASAIVVTAAAGTLTGNTLNAGVVNSSLTSVGTLGSLAVTGAVTAGSFTGPLTGNVTGNLTGNVTGNITGNAATATKLTPGNTINGVNFDGASA